MRPTKNFFTTQEEDMVEFVNSLPSDAYFLECDGRVCEEALCSIGSDKLIQIHFRMCGGKGGFGSMLRSFRIHKSSNQLMCRNLTGRRLADVKEEERLKKWVDKKAQREKDKEEKKQKKIEKLKSGSNSKHVFSDQDYLRKRDTVLDEVEDAVEAGMKVLEEEKKMENAQPADENAPTSSTAIEKQIEQPTTSSSNGQEEQSSSDSDIDLDEMMSCGPMKKKAKKS